MKKQPGLIIAPEGFDVQDAPRHLVFDSRSNIFKFIRRSENGGQLTSGHSRKAATDSYVTMPSFTIPHNLGYPPYFQVWYTSREADDSDIFEMREFSDVSIVYGGYCDEKNIYIVDHMSQAFNGNIDAIYLFIGTDNLESPPDKTVYIS